MKLELEQDGDVVSLRLLCADEKEADATYGHLQEQLSEGRIQFRFRTEDGRIPHLVGVE